MGLGLNGGGKLDLTSAMFAIQSILSALKICKTKHKVYSTTGWEGIIMPFPFLPLSPFPLRSLSSPALNSVLQASPELWSFF